MDQKEMSSLSLNKKSQNYKKKKKEKVTTFKLNGKIIPFKR